MAENSSFEEITSLSRHPMYMMIHGHSRHETVLRSEVHIDVRGSEACHRRCFWRWRELSFQTSTLACTPSWRLFHTPFTSPPLTTQLNSTQLGCQFSWVQFANCSQLQNCSVQFSCIGLTLLSPNWT